MRRTWMMLGERRIDLESDVQTRLVEYRIHIEPLRLGHGGVPAAPCSGVHGLSAW